VTIRTTANLTVDKRENCFPKAGKNVRKISTGRGGGRKSRSRSSRVRDVPEKLAINEGPLVEQKL